MHNFQYFLQDLITTLNNNLLKVNPINILTTCYQYYYGHNYENF